MPLNALRERVDKMERDEKRSRLFEVAVSIIVSAIASAGAVTWSLSATLEEFRSKISEHDKTLNAQWQRINGLEGGAQVNNAQVSAINAHYEDILRRLDSIDHKLEKK